MIELEQILRQRQIERVELARWIERNWLQPITIENEWRFEKEDIARIELICDLVDDLRLHPDAVDIILPLLDQIYSLRRSLKAMTHAVGELPADTRRQVLDRLSERLRK